MRISGLLWSASLCCLVRGATSLNILAIGTIATHSHFQWMDTLLTELLARGHHITEFTFKQPAPHTNRTTFVLESGLYSQEVMTLFVNATTHGNKHFLGTMFQVFEFCVTELTDNMASKAFQGLKKRLLEKKERIDVMVIDYGHRIGLIGLSQLVGYPPIVAVTAYNQPTAFNALMGSPVLPALVPHEESPYSCEMTFSQRIVNFIAYSYFRLIEVFYYEPAINQAMRKAISPDSPSLAELEQNISVAIANTHPTTHCEQPSTASIIEAGFLHIKPPKSLPEDIQKFLDDADNGVIVVSYGSMIRPEWIPGHQDTLLAVFRKLKQRILWKTPNPPENLPPNVLASKWLPQSDVLAHPNVRLIVTHGGTLSMQEAVYRGVPILMIPLYLDQQSNANRMASWGVGRILNVNQITVEVMTQEIRSILEDVKYKENMQRLSRAAQDQPDSPLHRAAFWVEFAGRHQGARHLRYNGRQMSWIQYYSVDVIASLIILVVLITLTVSTLCTRCLISRLINSRRKRKAE